jgi:16S rRNA (guanine527-N7)-methyltransferase
MMSADDLNVSRETLEKLRAFSALVEKWTAKINLISKPSIPYLWQRHVLDSAQIFSIEPSFDHWVDIGSGGGFPGIVIAIIAREESPLSRVTLIESDQRKSTFLRTAIRELDLSAIVISERIEAVDSQGADVLSARALADLPTLIGYAHRHLSPSGTCLFQKGNTWEKENEAAQKLWSYTFEAITSKTSPDAAILKIKDIARV